MRSTKAKWKRAPLDQRRIASERTAPKARFTRSQRSGALPPPLPSGADGRGKKPLLVIAGALVLLVVLSAALVIALGAFIRAEQQDEEMQWRASYYGRPTQPYSTLPPRLLQAREGTPVAMVNTPLPGFEDDRVLSFSAAASALTEPDGGVSHDSTLSSYCDKFGTPVSISIFDWNDWSTINLSNPMIAQMPIKWDASADMWRGYNAAKPFDQPDDARDRWRFKLFTEAGDERWMLVSESPTTPNTVYVYAFQVLTPYSNQQGQHFGYHPCHAFKIPYSDLALLLSSAGAYQSSGSRFPEFLPADDPRWQAVTVAPLNVSFDLRNIPTLLNNDPINQLSAPTSGYLATDVDWGVWAQIKLGTVTAWLDTSTVTIRTAQ